MSTETLAPPPPRTPAATPALPGVAPLDEAYEALGYEAADAQRAMRAFDDGETDSGT